MFYSVGIRLCLHGKKCAQKKRHTFGHTLIGHKGRLTIYIR